MATRAKKTKNQGSQSTTPKFPYTTRPNNLRKFLTMIPAKPKPQKIDKTLVKSWGFGSNEDLSIIRVLKAVDFIGAKNETTEAYAKFMAPGSGPKVLGDAVRKTWAPIFNSSHAPHKEPDETLRTLFNIHSGGSEKTINLQIQTLKALCESADLSEGAATARGTPAAQSSGGRSTADATGPLGAPQFRIELHIHLPENKSRRDYEYMFEDIARYIYGRTAGDSGPNE